MQKGVSLVVSAPSGTGKSTLCKMLLAEFPNLGFSISCATRAMRPGEVEGVDYYFISKAEFEKKVANDEFAEWAEVHGNFYGTPLKPAEERLALGKDILFDVDVRGARNIKNSMPESHFVFILPPSFEELERRIRGRGNESEESIQRRLGNAEREIREAVWYDSVFVNDDLALAYDKLRSSYIGAMLKPGRNRHLINSLLAEKLD